MLFLFRRGHLTKGSVVKLTDYRACPECTGFYCKETLRVHLQECSKKEYTMKEIKPFYSNLLYGKNQDKLTLVLSAMKEDNIKDENVTGNIHKFTPCYTFYEGPATTLQRV